MTGKIKAIKMYFFIQETMGNCLCKFLKYRTGDREEISEDEYRIVEPIQCTEDVQCTEPSRTPMIQHLQ